MARGRARQAEERGSRWWGYLSTCQQLKDLSICYGIDLTDDFLCTERAADSERKNVK
jgi:hypothetical protein